MKDKLIFIFLLTFSLSAFAVDHTNNTSTASKEKELLYEDPTGAQAYFNSDGTIQKILSSGEAELEFGDKKDERQALQKATMRAKASIAKFLSESIKSTDTLEEIQKTIDKAELNSNKTATRETVETQVEMIESKADALLQGVVTLQQDIDRDKKLVIVTVGLKEQTIQAAKNLQGKIASSEVPSAINPTITDTKSAEQGGKEIRRSQTIENFGSSGIPVVSHKI